MTEQRGKTTPGTNTGSFAPKSHGAPGGAAALTPPGTVLPSQNPATAPFSAATTLRDLEHHYEALTSPENISWDGERSGTDVQDAYRRLGAAYWARRDEIDPTRTRAYCLSCDSEVEGDPKTGRPATHDNDSGRRCWGST